MKHGILQGLRILGLLVAVFIGTIPFLGGVLFGAAVRPRRIAIALALVFAIAVTLCSSVYPQAFRIGPIDFKLHDGLYLYGIPALVSNTAKNLILSYIGSLTGLAFREGYHTERANKESE